MHWKHPYDHKNKEDKSILEKWKEKKTQYYENAINTGLLKIRIKETIQKKTI